MNALDPNRENHLRAMITIALNSSNRLKLQFREDMTADEFERLWRMINDEEILIEGDGLDLARVAYVMALKRARRELQGSNIIWGPNKEIAVRLLPKFNPRIFLVLGRAIDTIEPV